MALFNYRSLPPNSSVIAKATPIGYRVCVVVGKTTLYKHFAHLKDKTRAEQLAQSVQKAGAIDIRNWYAGEEANKIPGGSVQPYEFSPR